MKKNRKNLKGMTLYEMIISIAIFAVMTGVLIGVGTHIDKTNRATRNLKSRIVREAPVAANKMQSAGGYTLDKENFKIDISVKDTGFQAANVTMDAEKYNTNKVFVGKEADAANADNYNDGLNFQFVNIVTTTTSVGGPPTTTTTT